MTSHEEISTDIAATHSDNSAPAAPMCVNVAYEEETNTSNCVNRKDNSYAQQTSLNNITNGVTSHEILNPNDNAHIYNSTALYAKAEALYTRADFSIAKGLPKCNDWFCARDLFSEAGALFASAGYPDEAAKSFLKASVITHAFKSEGETTLVLSFAADNLQVLQPALAVDVLNSLSTTFKNSGHLIQAARCKREAALLLDHRLGESVKAIQMYKEAMELYGKRDIMKSFTRHCMERISALKVELMEYTEASQLFMEEAAMIHRHFPKTKPYLYSLLCLLAEGHGDDDRYFDALYLTRKRFDALQEEERDLQQGKEYQLMREIIEANDKGSLNKFDIALFTYKSCSTYVPDAVFDRLIEQCRLNLFNHVEQYM